MIRVVPIDFFPNSGSELRDASLELAAPDSQFSGRIGVLIKKRFLYDPSDDRIILVHSSNLLWRQ
jgi:hypothetical protein